MDTLGAFYYYDGFRVLQDAQKRFVRLSWLECLDGKEWVGKEERDYAKALSIFREKAPMFVAELKAMKP